jgi:hypothetical protein
MQTFHTSHFNSPMSAPQSNLSSRIIGHGHHPIRASVRQVQSCPTRTLGAYAAVIRDSPSRAPLRWREFLSTKAAFLVLPDCFAQGLFDQGKLGCTPLNDYFVSTRRRGRPPEWEWEIKGQSKPLGVRLYEGGFKSQRAARLAGRKALKELLNRIALEGS